MRPSLSIWEKESFFEQQDLIIVGSGFCGLWSALQLKLNHPHLKITILERGLLPTGASTRNAGFSCFGSPSEIISDAAIMGEESMWQLVGMRYRGLLEIRKHFTDGEIGYEASGGYECFTKDSEDWEECELKMNWLNDGLQKITGESNVFSFEDALLAGFGFEGFEHLIGNKLEGCLHPGRLVQALLRKVQSLGVQVFTGISVTGYAEQHSSISVATDHGIALNAGKLLICTNAFTPQLIPGIDIIPNRGQVLVTAPIANLRFNGTFHFNKGFYYFRRLGDRLLLGGAREKALEQENTNEMETTSLIQRELEGFIHRHLLPGTDFSITDRWAGIMGMGSKKTPIVEAISDHIFCCVRLSGMGVALAPVMAKQVAQLMYQ